MERIFFMLIVLSISCFGFTSTHNPFLWLQGTWEMKKSSTESRLEIWEKKDEMTLTGKGINVNDERQTIVESIELVFKGGHYWYIPTVPDQNNALPVPFKLMDASDNKFTFENAGHDFPQRIVYHFKPVSQDLPAYPGTGDTLDISVESLAGDRIDFRFMRK